MPIRIAGERPELTRAIANLAALALPLGITFTTANDGGIRSQADTVRDMGYRDDDYAVWLRKWKATHPGRTPISKYEWRPIAVFGSSYHNFGAARDLEILTGGPDALDRLGALAPRVGLRWGGTFPRGRTDRPHFELAIPLLQAKAEWLALGNAPGEATATAPASTVASVVAALPGALTSTVPAGVGALSLSALFLLGSVALFRRQGDA
jgi:hypothetical protein